MFNEIQARNSWFPAWVSQMLGETSALQHDKSYRVR